VTLTIFQLLPNGTPQEVEQQVTTASGLTADGTQANWTIDLSGASQLAPGRYEAVAQQANDYGQVGGAETGWTITGPSDGGVYAVQGVEVNQGTQFHRLDRPDSSGSASYTGVPLAAGKATAVRVFAAANHGITVSLSVYQGATLLGLLPPSNKTTPDLSTTDALTKEETDNGAYVFELPADWESGDTTLVANLQPADEVTDANGDCPDCRRFKLTGVHFWKTKPITFRFVNITDQQGNWPSEAKTQAYWNLAKTLIPSSDPESYLPAPAGLWWGSLTPSSDIQQEGDDKRSSDIQQQLSKLAAEYPSQNITTGISDDLAVGSSPIGTPFEGDAETVSIADYPLTDMTHEFYHSFGQRHSQTDITDRYCYTLDHVPADKPNSMGIDLTTRGILTTVPPGSNPKGLFHGVGLDMESMNNDGTFSVQGFGVSPFYDLMSYCAEHQDIGDLPWFQANYTNEVQWKGTDAGKRHVWLDPVEWTQVFPEFSPDYAAAHGVSTLARDVRAAPHAVTNSPLTSSYLAVYGSVVGGSVKLDSVSSAQGAEPQAGRDSPFTLVGKTASGHTVSARMAWLPGSTHETSLPVGTIAAWIPAAGLTSLTLLDDGTPVATRTRSPHAPTLKILSPVAGSRVGTKRTVRVAWRASDADGDPLTVDLDYSPNGGASWRPLFSGPAAGHIDMPSGFFSRSSRARVRVSVNDGFNTTTRLTGRFRAVGRSPAVAIESPANGTSVRNGSPLLLIGMATDDQGRRLRGGHLRWFDGPRLVGVGQTPSLTPQTPARLRLRLVATDRYGRSSSTTITIHVTTVKPQIIVLRQRGTLTAHSRTLALRLATNVPCQLRVGGVTAALDSTPRLVRIQIRPGRRPLEVTLRLRGGGRGAKVTYTVQRQGELG
jgi:hypothetical protein